MSIVQAEKEGHIESKVMKARQLEEIREARRIEAEKKEQEKQAVLNATKDSMKKKRKRNKGKAGNDDDLDGASLKDIASTSTRAAKPKKKVAFA